MDTSGRRDAPELTGELLLDMDLRRDSSGEIIIPPLLPKELECEYETEIYGQRVTVKRYRSHTRPERRKERRNR